MTSFVYDGSNGANANKIFDQLKKFAQSKNLLFQHEIQIKSKKSQDEDCHGHSLAQIEKLIDSCIFSDGEKLSDGAKIDAKGIYEILAECECTYHKKTRDTIHFHEIGREENVLRICQICQLVEKLEITEFSYTALNLGHGTIQCSHGILPVPAPATALLISDMETYTDEKEGELTTPSGAAIIKYFKGKKYGS
ncbi:MAG: LarC family nickel insertion protein [Treponemataceae bacterium]|nr:LarC family nickel insertion protein [Treponemataceae bacterium]